MDGWPLAGGNLSFITAVLDNQAKQRKTKRGRNKSTSTEQMEAGQMLRCFSHHHNISRGFLSVHNVCVHSRKIWMTIQFKSTHGEKNEIKLDENV